MGRQDATRFFQRYAHDFTAIYSGGDSPWSRFVNRRFRRSMLLRYQRSLASCEPVAGKSILDVGCGPGHYSVALARSGARRVVGIDSALAMIELARSRAERDGVADRCEFVCQSWEDFPVTEVFDHAICMGFLEYLDGPAAAIAKIMACTGISAHFSLPDRSGFLAWQRRLRYRFKTPLHMYTEAEVRSLFGGIPGLARLEVWQLARDFFVTALPAGAAPPGEPHP